MIDKDRLLKNFIELCSISSPGGQEKAISLRLKNELTELGFAVEEDDAGQKTRGNANNLIARCQGSGNGVPIFFSAHMDTVVPCDKVTPIVENGIVHSDGSSILGADDKAGIAAILEAVRVVKEQGLACPPLEIILTIQEEGGLKGAKVLDRARISSKFGYVLDAGGPPGTIVVQGPAQNHIEALIQGRAAHAGICPEQGVSAIKVASKAITYMKLGRIDNETTANIGTINGGTATNIIPERVIIKGEARSLSRDKLEAQTKHMEAAFELAAAEMGAQVKVTYDLVYPELALSADDPVVSLASDAAKALGMTPLLESTGGGADANIFNGYGIPTANLGIGMQKVHTTEEFITIQDLETDAKWVLEIIRRASQMQS